MNTPAIIYSETAEQNVLGALLINPDAAQDLTLRPDDFYIDRHRVIYQTITGLSARGVTPDFVTVVSSLDKQGKLSEIGGPAYLTQLANYDGFSFLAGQYSQTLSDYGRRRRALAEASKLATAAYDLSCDFSEQVGDIVHGLTMDVSARRGALPVSYYVDDLFQDVQNNIANPRGEIWGMKTGFSYYDKVTGGLQDKDGELLLVAGEPNVGKSIMVMQMAFELAINGYPGVIYSLEMRARQVMRRTISGLARFETRKLKTGQMNEQEINEFIRKCESTAGLNLYLSDESYMTTDDIRADVARLKSRYGIRWFALDYLYLLADGQGMKETERTTMVSNNLKRICRNFEVAGIVISSVSKAGMDGKETSGKSTIRGSGQQIHDADVVLFVREHQPESFEPKDAHMRTISFEKGRELDTIKGYFNLYKHDGFPYFENVTKKELNR